MRLWFLIALCVVSFLPVPLAIWLDALERRQAATCRSGQCEIRLNDWSAPKAVMPVSQHQPFNQAEGVKQGNAEGRQQGKACKHGRDFQTVSGLYDPPRQAGAAARTGDEFGDHRPNQRQATGYFRACQH